MLKHIVLFKLQEGKADAVDTLVEKLRYLPTVIDIPKSFEVGKNVVTLAVNWDVALVSTFESVEALMEYKNHPEHDRFVDYMRTVCEPIKAVDFEF